MATAASRETRVWEDLRKQARKHEGELDVKLAAYGKLCSSFDGGRGRGSGSTADQVTNKIAKQKAREIEALLQLLADINHDMSGVIAGVADSRSHTLARHRDILQDLTQEFRRLDLQLDAARERATLLAGAESLPLLGVQIHGQSAAGQLLRERATIGTSTHYVSTPRLQAWECLILVECLVASGCESVRAADCMRLHQTVWPLTAVATIAMNPSK
eukprot:GHUV01022541.1.p1 GENE.GHUV01022541.1~~GHUV01022541.1.p1  ORF type:complete len:216 (+),score=32.24 GHUV01022541.1:288-935(+)